jgi:hypothetical protein
MMELQRLRRVSLAFSLVLVGVGAAVTAAGSAYIGVHLAVPIPPADSWVFYLAAPLAALLIGPLFVWFFLIRPNRLTLRRGIVVGLLGSVVAHPLVWYLANLVAYLIGMPTAGFGILVMNPWLDLIGCLFLAPFSLLYVGWLTALLGSMMGASFTWAYRSCPRVQRPGPA